MRASLAKRLSKRDTAIYFAGEETNVRKEFMRKARESANVEVRRICVRAAREANRALVGHLRDIGPKPDYSWPTAKRDLAARFGTRN